MRNKIWNGKATGVVAAVYLGMRMVWRRLSQKISTCLFLSNVGRHGRNNIIMPGLRYRYPSSISLGDNVIIGSDTTFSTELRPGATNSAKLELGDGSSVGSGCKLDFTGGIFIKHKAHVAHNVTILTHDHGYDYEADPVGKPLVIEDHAFVGSNSTILFNCNYIGENAVVGVGSVVTKDVPDNAIVAGNPARIIKYITD